MRRPALYSSSSRSSTEKERLTASGDSVTQPETVPKRLGTLFRFARNDPRALWFVIGLLSLILLATLWLTLRPGARQLTQGDIDAAVLKTLENNVLPSPAAKAYEAILPSLVRVTSYVKNKDGDEDIEQSVGTGVVIVDTGIILTNLHVIQGAETIKVVFSDGLESTASVKGTQESDDLAVLQAHKIPDDLHAATMRSTADLVPGDQVVAVGFPFGIGPSASAGVVSGRIDGFVYAFGIGAGTLVYAEVFPWIKGFVNSNGMGQVTLPEVFDLPWGLVVFVVVLIAVAGFSAATLVERRFGDKA